MSQIISSVAHNQENHSLSLLDKYRQRMTEARISRHQNRADMLILKALSSPELKEPAVLHFHMRELPLRETRKASQLLPYIYDANQNTGQIPDDLASVLYGHTHPSQLRIEKFDDEVNEGINRAAKAHKVAEYGLQLTTELLFIAHGKNAHFPPPPATVPDHIAPLVTTQVAVVARISG